MPVAQSVSALIAFALILLALMWLGWRGRQRRTAPLVGALPQAPATLGEAQTEQIDGIYVSSTTHGDWLNRIAAQDLGYRSAANVSVYPHGVLIARQGAQDVYIPHDQLVSVSQAPGIAGKVVGGEGIVVIEWRLNAQDTNEETLLDTGFKPAHKKDRALLVNAINMIITSQPQAKESK